MELSHSNKFMNLLFIQIKVVTSQVNLNYLQQYLVKGFYTVKASYVNAKSDVEFSVANDFVFWS